MVNSAEVRACLTTLEKAEADLAALKAFEAADGRFRIHLSVEHHDPQIAEIISRLGKDHLSKSGLVGWLVKLAAADVSRATEALSATFDRVRPQTTAEQAEALSRKAQAFMAGLSAGSVLQSNTEADIAVAMQKQAAVR